MNRITKINPAIAPQAHAAIAKRCLESSNGTAIFKGLCYEVTIGGEVWRIGNGTQTFENTWNDASFGFDSAILAADTTPAETIEATQETTTAPALYRVVKIMRKSARRQILERNLTESEAQRVVARYPDSSRSMVVYFRQ
jgi:hypothetical protein